MMRPEVQYKVYSKSTAEVRNIVWQGDFERDWDDGHFSHLNNNWSLTTSDPAKKIYIDRNYSADGFIAGKAIQFNGTSSYMRLDTMPGSNPSVSNYIAFTVWAKMTDWQDAARRDLVGYYQEGGTNLGYGLVMNKTAGQLTAMIGQGGASMVTANYALTNLTDNTLYQIGFAYNGVALKIYINGSEVASTANTGAIVYSGISNSYLTLGANSTQSGNYWSGIVEHFAFWGNGTGSNITTAAGTFATEYAQKAVQTDSLNSYVFSLDDCVTGATKTFDSLLRYRATLSNVTVVTGEMSQSSSMLVQLSSATTGVHLDLNGSNLAVDSSTTYTLSAMVYSATSETISLNVTFDGSLQETKSITVGGDSVWRPIQLHFTTGAGTTAVDIWFDCSTITGGETVSLYVDKVICTAGTKVYDYFDYTSTSSATAVYYPDFANKQHIAKLTTYDYLTNWDTEVTSDFSDEYEMNTAGSSPIKITLSRPADNFGEGADVAWGNRVVINVINDNYPNGITKFIGKIEAYEPHYTEDDNESVIVTVMPYGAELADFPIESGRSAVITQADTSGTARGVGHNTTAPLYIGNGFRTAVGQTEIAGIATHMVCNVGSSQEARVRLWGTYSDAQYDTSWNLAVARSPLAESYAVVSSGSATWYDFIFVDTAGNPSPIRCQPDTEYWWTVLPTSAVSGGGAPPVFYVSGSDANPYADGYMFRYELPSGNVEYLSTDLAFKVYAPYGNTRVSYNSYDPSNILRGILDDYARQGGTLTYTDQSIDDTGTTVSYTFNNNSTLEGLRKCLELAPVNWYFYVDQATNTVHFHDKADATVHTLTLGLDFKRAAFNKRIDNIKNDYLFTGGKNPSNPDENLFRRYTDQSSIDLYGRRTARLSDRRVVVSATMDTMGQRALQTNNAPEVATEIDIAGTNYDRDLIKPGDVIKFNGFSNGSSSLWNVSEWDVDYWDYDIASLNALELQITHYRYSPDSINSNLSTIPPDVNKRIEDIARNLGVVEDENNPDTPD